MKIPTKAIFFNELKDLLLSYDSRKKWQNPIEITSKGTSIEMAHVGVPGDDSTEVFLGECLPKDSSAIVHMLIQ